MLKYCYSLTRVANLISKQNSQCFHGFYSLFPPFLRYMLFIYRGERGFKNLGRPKSIFVVTSIFFILSFWALGKKCFVSISSFWHFRALNRDHVASVSSHYHSEHWPEILLPQFLHIAIESTGRKSRYVHFFILTFRA